MLKKLGFILSLAVSAFAMHSVELNINDTDLELGLQFDVGQFNDNVEPDTTFVGFKFLNANNKYSSNKNQSSVPYYEANFVTKRALGSSDLYVGMGIKVNYTKNYTSVPLGLEFDYIIAKEVVPMYLKASIYYAPASLSFADADSFLEYRVGYDIEMIKNGHLFIGYRNLETNYTAKSYTYNRSWYTGFRFGF